MSRAPGERLVISSWRWPAFAVALIAALFFLSAIPSMGWSVLLLLVPACGLTGLFVWADVRIFVSDEGLTASRVGRRHTVPWDSVLAVECLIKAPASASRHSMLTVEIADRRKEGSLPGLNLPRRWEVPWTSRERATLQANDLVEELNRRQITCRARLQPGPEDDASLAIYRWWEAPPTA